MDQRVSTTSRTYIAIDLKSFYASVECVERNLDPLTTNLVVADVSRTEKTICLAVSPSLKAYGIGGRARLFEAVQQVKKVNYERQMALRKTIGRPWAQLTGKSYDDNELKEHPDWAVDYIAAPPRMALYVNYSTRIYDIYLRYIAPEDIHVYSIDEVFMDVTDYLATYKMTAHELAMTMIRHVLRETGITATAGIGTNLYLCKVAMDIVAKHVPADKDGVRIAELDELSYRQKLWNHKPLTAFWRFGRGITERLKKIGVTTMGELARTSLTHEELLYKLFGINAELIIDHAWGWEPCTIDHIKAYRPETNSLSSGQVLTCPYTFKKAFIVVTEMADAMALDLFDKGLVTNQLVLTIGYDIECLTKPDVSRWYSGPIHTDYYGRQVPKAAHATINLETYTSSSKILIEDVRKAFSETVNPHLLIRRINISANHVISEEKAVKLSKIPVQLDLFTDYETLERENAKKKAVREKERKMQEAILAIKKQFGKNAILRGTSFEEGATARERNQQIGGHKA